MRYSRMVAATAETEKPEERGGWDGRKKNNSSSNF